MATFLNRLGPLRNPLTAKQADEIRALFRRKRHPVADADRLIADWPRIAEKAHQHALESHTRSQVRVLWSKKDVRRRRDAQLSRAISAANQAIAGIGEFTELWGKHCGMFDGGDYKAAVERWAESVTEELIRMRNAAEAFRADATQWPIVPAKKGPPFTPEGYFLTVLAVYFDTHGWRVSTAADGLFASLANIWFGTASINYSLLRDMRDLQQIFGKAGAKARRE